MGWLIVTINLELNRRTQTPNIGGFMIQTILIIITTLDIGLELGKDEFKGHKTIVSTLMTMKAKLEDFPLKYYTTQQLQQHPLWPEMTLGQIQKLAMAGELDGIGFSTTNNRFKISRESIVDFLNRGGVRFDEKGNKIPRKK